MGFLAPFIPLITTGVGTIGGAAMQIHGVNVTVGQAKERATAIVNSHEGYMKANVDAVRSGARNPMEGLVEYDRLWQSMTSKLRELGSVGEKSIAERSPTGIWPYQTRYRAPIESMAGTMSFAPPPPAGATTGGPVYEADAHFVVDHEEPGPLPGIPGKPDYTFLYLALAGIVATTAVVIVKKR